MSGFFVWNPAAGLPTRTHSTLARAAAEAYRLKCLNPAATFYVMAPLLCDGQTERAQQFSDGVEAGLAQAHREIMRAEAAADRNGEEVIRLQGRLRSAQPILDQAWRFQAIVADALLWFDGFAAAYAAKESYERPNLPDRQDLKDLSRHLQNIETQAARDLMDEEIPF
jgi:hypothetical protein